MVPSERTVTIATGHGKKQPEILMLGSEIPLYEKPTNNPLVTIEKLQIWFKTNAEAKAQQHLEIEKPVETLTKLLQVIPPKKQFTKHNVVFLAEIVSSAIVVMERVQKVRFQKRKRRRLHHQLRFVYRLWRLRRTMSLSRFRYGFRKLKIKFSNSIKKTTKWRKIKNIG